MREEGEKLNHRDTEGTEKVCVEDAALGIARVCDGVKGMLLEKNARYGNSALAPLRIFSRAGAEEQILVRLDDKLSRLKHQVPGEDEDVILDLIGYLVLLRVARFGKEEGKRVKEEGT